MLGNFYSSPWGELNTHWCLNIILINHTLVRVLAQYAVLCRIWKDMSQAIPCILLHQHQSWEQLHAASLPWVHPPTQLCCPNVASELGPLSAPVPGWSTRECWGCFLSSPRGSSLPCKEPVLSLAFLLPSRLTPSCSWVFLPHIWDNSSVTNKPCWGVTIRISSSTARFQRLEHAMDRFFNIFPLRNSTSEVSPHSSSATNYF